MWVPPQSAFRQADPTPDGTGEVEVHSNSTWAVVSVGVGAVTGAVRGWQMRYRAALAIGVRSGLLDPRRRPSG